MKRIILILAFCVSLGTLARSQVIISGHHARQLIAKLDSLDHLRAGYAILDSANQTQQQMLAISGMTIKFQDSIIAIQDSAIHRNHKQLAIESRQVKFWRRMAAALGLTSLLAIVYGAAK